MEGSWCLIESDPAVFNDLLSSLGVKGVQVEEIASLTDGNIGILQTTLKLTGGLVPVCSIKKDGTYLSFEEATEKSVYFVNQSLQNACATLAILNLMLNIDRSQNPDVELGSILSNFLEFTESLDFETRGLALSNCEEIVNTHNKYREVSLFDHVESSSKTSDAKKENPFHYTVFMPVKDRLYELDGLRKGPIDLGIVDQADGWVQKVVEIVKSRMSEALQKGNDRFNIMAICGDLIKKYKSQHAKVVADAGNGIPTEQQMMDMARLEDLVRIETEKMEKHKQDTVFRLHNWTSFVIELLKLMAAKKVLKPAVNEALSKADK